MAILLHKRNRGKQQLTTILITPIFIDSEEYESQLTNSATPANVG